MTEEKKATIAQKLTEWDADKLLQAFVYYSQHFNPFGDDNTDKYELIRAEILRRMNK